MPSSSGSYTNQRSVLFVHGAGAEDPTGLAAYLRSSLESYEVIAPRMPQAEAPRYEPWRDAVARAHLEAGDQPMLVGHSLGGSVLLKYLTENPEAQRIGGLFLVAAPYWGCEGWSASEYTLLPGYTKRLPSDVPVFIYHSRDDQVVAVSHGARYAQEIAWARFRVLEGRGHDFRSGLPELVNDIDGLGAV